MNRFFLFSFLLFLLSTLQAQTPPMACPENGTTPAFANNCLGSCVLCDIDGYQGINNLPGIGQLPASMCPDQYISPHNTQWVGFLAGTETLTLKLSVSNCQVPDPMSDGLQMAVYSGNDCDNLTLVSSCFYQVPDQMSVVFDMNDLQVGGVYFLIIDGFSQDICEYLIEVQEGSTVAPAITEAPTISGPTVVCPGELASFEISTSSAGASFYEWTVDGAFVTTGSNPSISIPNAPSGTVVNVCATPSNSCQSGPATCMDVTIQQGPPIAVSTSICAEEFPTAYVDPLGNTQLITGPGVFLFESLAATGCIQQVEVTVTAAGGFAPTFIQAAICLGDSLNGFFWIGEPGAPNSQIFTSPQTATEVNLTSSMGCDSLVILDLAAYEPSVINIDTVLCAGASISIAGEVFDEAGFYEVIRDNVNPNGCDSLYQIQISNSLPHEIIPRQDTFQFCQGDSSTLITGFDLTTQPDLWINTAPPYGFGNTDTLALPDGDGSSYQTTIEVQGFPDDAVFSTSDETVRICAVMEHSYMRDLEIQLICPDSNAITLLPQIQTGGQVFMGEPYEQDESLDTPIFGLGYEYCWVLDTNVVSMLDYINNNSVSTLPVGDYGVTTSSEVLNGCSYNGTWTLQITDYWAIDNGVIFGWSIEMGADINPLVDTPPPGVFSWDFSEVPPVTNEFSLIPDNTVPGFFQYPYQYIDGNGCYTVDSILVEVQAPPSLSIEGDTLVCQYESALLTASGANSYLWSTGDSTASISPQPNAPTTYELSGFSSIGCSSDTSWSIQTLAAPDFGVVAAGDSILCAGEEVTIQTDTLLAGMYAWSNGATGPATQLIMPEEATTYSLTITDNAGCSGTASIELAPFTLIADPGPVIFTCESETQLMAQLPDGATGTWVADQSNNYIIEDPNDPNSSLFNLQQGTNFILWSITSEVCPQDTFFRSLLIIADYQTGVANNDTIMLQTSASMVSGNVLLNDVLPTFGSWQTSPLSVPGIGELDLQADGSLTYSYFKPVSVRFQYLLAHQHCPDRQDIATVFLLRPDIAPGNPGNGFLPTGYTPDNGDLPATEWPIMADGELVLYNALGQVVDRKTIIGPVLLMPKDLTSKSLPTGLYHYWIRSKQAKATQTGSVWLK